MSEQDRSKCPWCAAPIHPYKSDDDGPMYVCLSFWINGDEPSQSVPCQHFATLAARVAELEQSERDLLDSVMACLVAAGAPDPAEVGIDANEAEVRKHGTKPSDYVRAQLAALRDKLPKTADNVTVTPGMTTYDALGFEYPAAMRCEPPLTCIVQWEETYSTREAAQAARLATPEAAKAEGGS